MSVNKRVEITVITEYLANESDPEQEKFIFSYRIQLTNHLPNSIKLKSRYWLITYGNGNVAEVEGDGVVGLQPRIAPNKAFSYTSGVILPTPVGTMQGHYLMDNEDGSSFRVPIPVFRLAMPGQLH
jgi:ApaG protein